MIATTYAIAGVALAVAAQLFAHGLLDATTQTLAWTIIFFFASAAASSAYLTVSEIFPLEMRALAIAIFYSAGTAVGGLTGNDSTYLAALYAAGVQGSFDAVGVHTDTACNITSPYVYQYDRVKGRE